MKHLAVLLFSILLFAGCSKKDNKAASEESDLPAAAPAAPAAPAAGSAAQTPAEEAKTAFGTLCASCHGTSGQGDGPAAAALETKPRNYTDKAWQASVTDDEIKKIILEGGQAVGKSPLMPAWTQFKDKPEVVDELVKIVRSYGK